MNGAVAQSASREQRFPAAATSVSASRVLVRQLLDEVDRADLADTAALVLSEMVTNALLHAGTPVDVLLTWDDRGLLAHVGDGNKHVPTRRSYGATSGTGRGLRLLEELVDEWGVNVRSGGKTVWFRMAVGAGSEEAGTVGDPGENEESTDLPVELEDPVHVRLLNMPLLLHSAWQEYAETLLREYLLVMLDNGPEGEDAFRIHARATAAIAVLEEQIPHADVTIEPEQLMADAVEPRVSAASVSLEIPREALVDFHTLDVTIEEGLQLSRSGRLITPPSQPEIQEFRRWLCAEVRRQAEGADPVPWSMDDVVVVLPDLDLHWDTSRVLESAAALVAADETNLIVAVSPAALRLLKYDDPTALVGDRIVAIVPERLRQSHVAGFMMYLLTGRQPLVGVTVPVPALCADGSELDIALTVNVETAGDGRTVFVAEMRPA